MRLIDADALDMFERLNSYYGDAWRDAQKEIDEAPTVDAVPVRHGNWEIYVISPFDGEDVKCSECGERGCVPYWNYCPNCGAKMDGERKEE